MTREQLVEQFRTVWRRAQELRATTSITEREHMIAGDVQRSAQGFADELKDKQHTPTKMRAFLAASRHLNGMLDRIEQAMKGRAA